MYFQGAYLRVLTPKTTNGMIPLIENGQQVFIENFLPLTAKKQLERKNQRLTKNGFGHLVAKIEIVGENPQPVFSPPQGNLPIKVTGSRKRK